MSGSGSSFYYTPSFKKKEEVSCDLLNAETTLCNPDEDLLLKVKVGDILPVAIYGTTLTVMVDKEVLGTIEIPQKNQFILCLKSGTFYVAQILSIKDGICRIKIYAQSL